MFIKSYIFLTFLRNTFLPYQETDTTSRRLEGEQKARYRTQRLRALQPLIDLINTIFLLIALLIGGLLPSPAVAARITLAWNASLGPVDGYRVYYRSTTTHYTTILPAPPSLVTSTTYITPDLPAGTYYFAVKAFGRGDSQSGFSNEVKAIISAQPIEETTNGKANSTTNNTTPSVGSPTTATPSTTAGSPTTATPSTTATTPTESSSPSQIPVSPLQRLTNLSTRGWVGTGDQVMIIGFGITGTTPKQVLIRALGPSLASAGMSNLLYDPTLTLHKGQSVLASNDNWQEQQATAIKATGKAPQDPQEAAILATLDPGIYTAVVHGVSDTTGNALVEIFETASTESTLTNLSTRGRTEARDGVMIAGFIIGGTQAKRVLIRAIGPTLSAAGVSDALADPTLALYKGQTRLASNNNWRENQAPEIEATGKAPGDLRESALITTLMPGPYTAIVRGANDVAGNTLIEVYDLRD